MPKTSASHLRLLRFWKRQWKESPTLMEEARQRAVQAAQKAYHDRNLRVREMVQAWPGELTNHQLRERCVLKAAEMDFHPRSFKTKVVRLGLIQYDHKRKLWVNRCLLCQPDAPLMRLLD